MRTIIEHSSEGLEFTPGNAADIYLRLSGSHMLARAIVYWNNLRKEDLLEVPSLIKSYMSQVNRSDWERHPWASQVISLMWVRFARQVETFEVRKGMLQDLGWQEEDESRNNAASVVERCAGAERDCLRPKGWSRNASQGMAFEDPCL